MLQGKHSEKIGDTMVRRLFFTISIISLTVIVFGAQIWPELLWFMVIIGPLVAVGLHDSFQKKHTILRNFPVIGHLRFLFEMIRPEIQ